MFKSPFGWLLIVIFILFILVCFAPIIITQKSWISLGVDKPNEIGDTIGGIMGPIVGFIGAIATFFAFWMQYKANQEQFKQFKNQNDDIRVERFENRFYELLKIHRDNVQEFEIVRYSDSENKLTGRRIFVSMVEELQLSYKAAELANNILIWNNKIKRNYFSKEELFLMAYLVFFDGVSTDRVVSNNQPTKSLRYKILGEKYDEILSEFLSIVENIRTGFKNNMDTFSKTYVINNEEDKGGMSNISTLERIPYPKLKYIPFSGHNARLGHYFRHLYQTVKYVVEQDDKIIKDKYAYVKIIRAQLSNFEQVLLYYNSISIYGKPWISENYLTNWRMIKNMPLYVANFGPLPKDVLGETNSNGDKLFEVDEVEAALAQ